MMNALAYTEYIVLFHFLKKSASNKWQRLQCRGDRPNLLEEHSMIAHKVNMHGEEDRRGRVISFVKALTLF